MNMPITISQKNRLISEKAGRREAFRSSGNIQTLWRRKTVVFVDRKKEAARRMCRGITMPSEG